MSEYQVCVLNIHRITTLETLLRYLGCENGFNHSQFFKCLILSHQKNIKKTTTFKLIELIKHTKKHAITTEDRILIKYYRLDENIEIENWPPNSPDLNTADYSILENLSQKLYKHQRIRDMQNQKDLLEE